MQFWINIARTVKETFGFSYHVLYDIDAKSYANICLGFRGGTVVDEPLVKCKMVPEKNSSQKRNFRNFRKPLSEMMYFQNYQLLNENKLELSSSSANCRQNAVFFLFLCESADHISSYAMSKEKKIERLKWGVPVEDFQPLISLAGGGTSGY